MSLFSNHFEIFQIEILETGYFREEKTYDCCPDEKYPNIKYSFRFKHLGWLGSMVPMNRP